MRLSSEEIRTDVLYQIGAVYAFARAAGLKLQHVKPHGQLNNMAVQDAGMASAVAQATASFDEELILISAGGELTVAGERAGLKVAHEVYADRAYTAAGTLVPRSRPGALIHDPAAAAERAVAMVRDGSVTATTGESLSVKVDTICLHADTGGASEIARRLRQELESAGISVRPLAEILPG